MRLKPFIILILLGTLLSWISWGFVLVTIDPFFAEPIAFIFFYLSLFVALIGTISLVFLAVYTKLVPIDAPVYRVVSRSLRDGLLVAVLLVTLLVLQGLELLTIWNIGIFVVLLLLALSFYLTLQGQQS
jgi:hypothetical protein